MTEYQEGLQRRHAWVQDMSLELVRFMGSPEWKNLPEAERKLFREQRRACQALLKSLTATIAVSEGA